MKKACDAARDVMTPAENVATTRPDDDVVDALRRLGTANVGHLPVVDDAGRLVGMFIGDDVARWLALHTPPSRRPPFGQRPRHA